MKTAAGKMKARRAGAVGLLLSAMIIGGCAQASPARDAEAESGTDAAPSTEPPPDAWQGTPFASRRCTPGRRYRIACSPFGPPGMPSACPQALGTCRGRAALRVCNADYPALVENTRCYRSAAGALADLPEACASTCPSTEFVCPSTAAIEVLVRPLDSDPMSGCAPDWQEIGM